MLKHIILKLPLPPCFLRPPRGVCKVGRTNMVSNIKSIELKSPVSTLCAMSSGHMDLCTFFGIWDTGRAIANC